MIGVGAYEYEALHKACAWPARKVAEVIHTNALGISRILAGLVWCIVLAALPVLASEGSLAGVYSDGGEDAGGPSLTFYDAACSEDERAECVITRLSCPDKGVISLDVVSVDDAALGRWLLRDGATATLESDGQLLKLKPRQMTTNDMDGGWYLEFYAESQGSSAEWLLGLTATPAITMSTALGDTALPTDGDNGEQLRLFLAACAPLPQEASGASFVPLSPTTERFAKAIEKAISDFKLPNGYIIGSERSRWGVRQGEGVLYTRNQGNVPVFWNVAVVGTDLPEGRSSVMMLVYDLPTPGSVFGDFAGPDGSARGLDVGLLTGAKVVIVPVRFSSTSNVGIRLETMTVSANPSVTDFSSSQAQARSDAAQAAADLGL